MLIALLLHKPSTSYVRIYTPFPINNSRKTIWLYKKLCVSMICSILNHLESWKREMTKTYRLCLQLCKTRITNHHLHTLTQILQNTTQTQCLFPTFIMPRTIPLSLSYKSDFLANEIEWKIDWKLLEGDDNYFIYFRNGFI